MSWGEGWRGEGGAVQIFNYNENLPTLVCCDSWSGLFHSLFIFLPLPLSSSLFLSPTLFFQERLCLRNAELSDALAATRHSRTLLERELISLKRSHLEARSRQAQLEASLREVEREREELAERVASSEGEGRRRLREMQRQVGGRTVA